MIGVCIVTYNQEQYIAQCIDSALGQCCDEEVRIYVGNDCSSDRTAEICRSYGDKIVFVNRPKNLGLVGNTMKLLELMRHDGCNYIAMLDGDDYWIDPLKLQKQIDYFTAHPEYGLVHTYVDKLYPDGIYRDNRQNVPEGDVWQLIGNYAIGNCSVMFRVELLDLIDFDEFQQQNLLSCDYSMYAIFASKWHFGFLPEHTAVWRRGIESVSGSESMDKQIAYVQNDLAHWKYLAEIFPERWKYTDEEGERYLHTCAFNIAFRFGNYKRTLQEMSLMSKEDRKKHKLKVACARTWLSFQLFRFAKKIKTHYSYVQIH